jgi:hypothetical protein
MLSLGCAVMLVAACCNTGVMLPLLQLHCMPGVLYSLCAPLLPLLYFCWPGQLSLLSLSLLLLGNASCIDTLDCSLLALEAILSFGYGTVDDLPHGCCSAGFASLSPLLCQVSQP